MTIENSKGKPRITRARKSDVADGGGTGGQRSPDRDAKGRAALGNKLASGRAWKWACAQLVPDSEQARAMYRSALRQLQHDGPGARAACARWVVATIRASELDRAAVRARIGTPKSNELLELARKYGVEADREWTSVCTYSKRKTPAQSATTGATSKAAQMRAKAKERGESPDAPTEGTTA